MDGTAAQACTGSALLCLISSAWSWLGTGPLANYIQVFGGMSAGGLAVYRWMRKRRTQEKLRLEKAGELITSLERERSALADELEHARQFDPRTWIESAKKERRDGNRTLATQRLREGLDGVREPLFQVFLELSQAAKDIEQDGDPDDLEEGVRHAVSALQLRPDSAEAEQTLGQLRAIAVLIAILDGRHDAAHEAAGLLPVATGGSAMTVGSLLARGVACRDQGEFILSERLIASALRIAERELGSTARETHLAMWHHCEALMNIGASSEAIGEIRVARHHYAELLDEDIAVNLSILEANALLRTGHYAEALAILDAIPAQEDPQLAQHISLRRADALKWLGRHAEALTLLPDLVDPDAGLSNASDFDVTRSNLRADVLLRAGRHADGLRVIEAVVKTRTERKGISAPSTVESRYLEADAHMKLENFERSAALAEPLLREFQAQVGPTHPDTLGVHHLLVVSWHRLDRLREALDRVTWLVQQRELAQGERHPETLSARFEKADLLSSLGRYDEALLAVDKLIELRREVSGELHRDTLSAWILRVLVLFKSGSGEMARAEASLLAAPCAEVFGGGSAQAMVMQHIAGQP